MAEAEVSLRLANWLIVSDRVESVDVGIDGAQVRIGGDIHFNITNFLGQLGWRKATSTSRWQGSYAVKGTALLVTVHSLAGRGDVVAKLRGGGILRAECKKGPLVRRRASIEYKLLREALGQLLTVSDTAAADILVAAVPHTEKFAELASRWRNAPLVKRAGIHIATVDPGGAVLGLSL